jgi:hypothetical protein
MNRDLIEKLRDAVRLSREIQQRSQQCWQRAQELEAQADELLARADRLEQRALSRIANSRLQPNGQKPATATTVEVAQPSPGRSAMEKTQ